MLTKAEVRINKKLVLKSINKEKKLIWEDLILNKIICNNFIYQNQTVAIYASLDYEVSTKKIIQFLWNNNVNVCLPKIVDQEIVFFNISEKNLLIKNKFAIKEPSSDLQKVDPKEIDLIFVPLIAFNSKKHRIGHGHGYYDRFLLKLSSKTHKIGLAFQIQYAEYNFDYWDVPLDEIITN